MLDQVINKQKGISIDSQPVTLTAKDYDQHGTDGDYFSKPSLNDIRSHIQHNA